MALLSEHKQKNRAKPRRGWLFGATFVLAFLPSPPAYALQPLTAFLQAARQGSVEARLAATRVMQADGDRQQSRLGLAPVLGIDAGYTLNQYEAIAQRPNPDPSGRPLRAVITPMHQLDASFRITQPLVDVGKWMDQRTSLANVRTQAASREQSLVELDGAIARAYYQVVAAAAVVESTGRSIAVAQENQRIVQARMNEEMANELDVQRAIAELESVRQTQAEAEFQLAVALRTLHSGSGLLPSEPHGVLQVELHDEAALTSWETKVGPHVASVGLAHARAEVARADYSRARAVFYPNLALFAQERFTNAVGFIGKNAIGSLGITLNWRLDLSAFPALTRRRGEMQVAALQAEKALQVANDEVHRQWQAVRASIAKSRAARAQVAATTIATARAKERYSAGSALLYEVIQSERDQLQAEVRQIQADADLVLSRVLLRIAAGEEIVLAQAGGAQ